MKDPAPTDAGAPGEAMNVLHFDLRPGQEKVIAGHEASSAGRDALAVFWWGDLPLGMFPLSAAELPLGEGWRRSLAASFAAEQRSARDPALGAPLTARSDGTVRLTTSLEASVQIEGMMDWLEATANPSDADARQLAVLICTRDRPAALSDCLTALSLQRSPPGEIVVIDNSATQSARSVCEGRPGVTYLHEPRSGLSHARNTGIRAVSHEFVAFTDDDVTPHPGWTAEVVRAFAVTDAEALTGLVLPMKLETRAQRCFQMDMGGFGSRFTPALFGQSFFAATRHRGAQVWRIGAGANMAFRRSTFDRIGLFDTRLGAGASGCSEDSEMWYRILASGGACYYEPRAVVFHDHRSDWPGLRSQIRAYMRGHVSALIVQSDTFGDRGNLKRVFLQLPRYFLRTALGSLLNGRKDRGRLIPAEVAGWLAGLTYMVRPGWRSGRQSDQRDLAGGGSDDR